MQKSDKNSNTISKYGAQFYQLSAAQRHPKTNWQYNPRQMDAAVEIGSRGRVFSKLKVVSTAERCSLAKRTH